MNDSPIWNSRRLCVDDLDFFLRRLKRRFDRRLRSSDLFCRVRFLLLCHLVEHANEIFYRTRLAHLINKILLSFSLKRSSLFIVSRCFVCLIFFGSRRCRCSPLFLYFHMWMWKKSELWLLFLHFLLTFQIIVLETNHLLGSTKCSL
jgi:hypothetical protein